MAKWETTTLDKVIQGITDNSFVLPVIQRNLVWNESKMELLFDSLIKANSFGGIMVLEEYKGEKPLFAFRIFSKQGEPQASSLPEILDQGISMVIDGQQRLQAFYMGLQGRFQGKQLFYNLYCSELDNDEFRFSADVSKLPSQEREDSGAMVEELWYPVDILFSKLVRAQDEISIAEEIIRLRGINDESKKNLARANVIRFFRSVFIWKTIGISMVTVNKSQVDTEKQRIVELFRRLNDGGTRLSAFDLFASTFKSYDYRIEAFLRDVREFEDIGISQDDIIKLTFLLQDSHTKEVTDTTAEDVAFVIENRERIIQALRALRKFLEYTKLYKYFNSGGRSAIPLYFVAYHTFHKKNVPNLTLDRVYDNYDAKNDDFPRLKSWIFLSILNGVFSRGKGWIPYQTGMRKILNVVSKYKGKLFPVEELFQIYQNHPINFSAEMVPERLNDWDREFVFYLIYDFESPSDRDIDHVHPKSLLEAQHVPPQKVHSLANFQLLDEGTNRNEKRAKPLADWLKSGGVGNLDAYLKKHLIPEDNTLWEIAHFETFLGIRTTLIIDKIGSQIPGALAVESIPAESLLASQGETKELQVISTDALVIDKEALQNLLSPEQRSHSILKDSRPLREIFRAEGMLPAWLSRYDNALAAKGIRSIADFALFVMALKLEFRYPSTWGQVYGFHDIMPGGQKVLLEGRNFGGWPWKIILSELEERGFDWKAYLVK